MPTTEAYNGAHSGQQIDNAVSAVIAKEVTWDGKGSPAVSTTITLTAAGWTGNSAPYSQQVACSIVKSDSAVVSVDAQTSGDMDANAEILNAWALVSQKDPKQGNGTLGFYATEKPTVNIPVKVGVS